MNDAVFPLSVVARAFGLSVRQARYFADAGLWRVYRYPGGAKRFVAFDEVQRLIAEGGVVDFDVLEGYFLDMNVPHGRNGRTL